MAPTDPAPTRGDTPDVTLRPATAEDLLAVAEVFLATRAAAVPAMPALVHPPDEVRAFVASWRLDPGVRELWVAEAPDAGVVGFAELKGDWLDDLYVHPDRAGRGIGSALLDLAKAHRPEGFSLWVFVSNEPARRFYRDRGLVELEHTDGSGNEEHAPDVRMAWPGDEPVDFFRARIDEVDGALALLLAQRTALSGAVQDHKEVGGHAGRDPARERAIADRMARLAPDLDRDSLQRIVHTIVAESLHHWERNIPPGQER